MDNNQTTASTSNTASATVASAPSAPSFPPVKALFADSWQTFTQSILSLFILNIIGIVIYIGLAILAVVAFIISGAGSYLLKNGLQNIATTLPSVFSGPNFINLIITASVIAVIFAVLFVIISSVLQIASIIIVDQNGKASLGNTLKRGFGLIIPLSLTGILAFVLTVGAVFVLILPALLFAFLLVFVQYEVILNNQKWTAAIKRSVTVVSHHFGAIFLRLLLLWLIGIGFFVFSSILQNILPKDSSWAVSIISFFFNLLFGWFSLAYSITLYKQAKSGMEQEKGKGIAWMWIVAIIGWLIAIGLGVVTYKVMSSGFFNELSKKSTITNSPGLSMQQSIDDMQPEAKIHYDKSQEIFKKLREMHKDAGISDEQLATETKKLNDENIAGLKKALEIEPNNPRIWYELGNAYTWLSSQGSLEDSLAAFKKAEEFNPDNVVYINGVGDVLIRIGRNEEAVLHFQKSLRLTDESGFANLSVAKAYANLKIYDSAKEHYQKAIDIFTAENKYGSYDDEILQAKKELSVLPK
ncbi:tetratricopeptide repeat protein [Candidatus Daviesbacteria bacterium]|nr:tetratricopeptide repeat protein [Candidatus Daviesbacteria bacterium]